MHGRAAALTAMLLAGGCIGSRDMPTVPGGEPERGKAAMARYGCGACHEIAGETFARGKVGPPLTGVARRAVLAGHISNTPDNMIRWIMDPQLHEPGTVMPEMGVTETEARDIAAFLYSLK